MTSLPPVLHRRRSVRIGIRLRHSVPRSRMNAGVARRCRRGARLVTTRRHLPGRVRPVHRHNEAARAFSCRSLRLTRASFMLLLSGALGALGGDGAGAEGAAASCSGTPQRPPSSSLNCISRRRTRAGCVTRLPAGGPADALAGDLRRVTSMTAASGGAGARRKHAARACPRAGPARGERRLRFEQHVVGQEGGPVALTPRAIHVDSNASAVRNSAALVFCVCHEPGDERRVAV